MNQPTIKPGDIGVALALAMAPRTPLAVLAAVTERSIGEVHNAIRRLGAGRLLKPGERDLAREPFLRFLQWGMPVAFPAQVGGVTRGIATALVLGPDEAGLAEAAETDQAEFVWPNADGTARGQALTPLYPAAPNAAMKDARFRRLLALVDLVRVGGAREQALALDHLERILTEKPN